MLWALQPPASVQPGSLPVPQYFTAFVSAIDSAVNPAPHPWKRFRILIPLPSPVHLNLNAFCKQDFMHDRSSSSSSLHCFPPHALSLFLISSPHFLAYYFSKESMWRWLQLLWARENVQCTIVVMEQADRQAALPPSFLSLACLPDSQALHSFMAHSFGGALGSKSARRRGRKDEVCVSVESVY